MQHHIQEAPLSTGKHFRYSADGFIEQRTVADEAETPRSLGSQDIPIGKKGESPKGLEAIGNDRHVQVNQIGIQGGRLRMRGKHGAGNGQRNRQVAKHD